MDVVFSKEFKKEFKKIKNYGLYVKIVKALNGLREHPYSGKPLRHNLKEHRSIRIKPFRVIYRIKEESIFVICFDHREYVYD